MRNVSKLQDFALLLQGAYNQLEEKYSEQHIVDQIHFHGITQLVNQTNILPHALAASLSENTKMSVAVELMKKNALDELFKAFNEKGFENTLLFKGSALAHSLYDHSWLRPRTDNDVLIDKAKFKQYKKILEQQGYQQLLSMDGEFVSYQSSFIKNLSDNVAHTIDVHWKISNRQLLANCFSLDELLVSALKLNGFTNPIFIPSNINSLIIAAIHRIGHHANEERLIWLYDIHLLCNTLNQKDWQTLLNITQQKQVTHITYEALSTCKKLLASNIPEEILQKMKREMTNPEPSAFFLQRNLPEWKYFWHDMQGLDTTLEKIKLLGEHILPSRQYMMTRTGESNLLSAYLKRLVNGCKRVFKA